MRFSARSLRPYALGLGFAAAFGPAACRTGSSAGPEPHPRRVTTSGPITRAELASVGVRDAYSAIMILRPQFLHDRGANSLLLDVPTEPDVFVDGQYYGRVDLLRDLPVQDLLEIRRLSVGDAVVRYGPGHPAGVIDIATRRQ